MSNSNSDFWLSNIKTALPWNTAPSEYSYLEMCDGWPDLCFFSCFPESTYPGEFPVPPPYSIATSLPTYDEAEKAKAAAMAASAVEVIPRVSISSVTPTCSAERNSQVLDSHNFPLRLRWSPKQPLKGRMIAVVNAVVWFDDDQNEMGHLLIFILKCCLICF